MFSFSVFGKFLYDINSFSTVDFLKCGETEKANALASILPHTRESREVIQPLMSKCLDNNEINTNIKHLLIGDSKHQNSKANI